MTLTHCRMAIGSGTPVAHLAPNLAGPGDPQSQAEMPNVITAFVGEGVPQEAVDDFAERLNKELGRRSG